MSGEGPPTPGTYLFVCLLTQPTPGSTTTTTTIIITTEATTSAVKEEYTARLPLLCLARSQLMLEGDVSNLPLVHTRTHTYVHTLQCTHTQHTHTRPTHRGADTVTARRAGAVNNAKPADQRQYQRRRRRQDERPKAGTGTGLSPGTTAARHQ